MPHPSRLCTEVAKRPETIRWADGRARFGVIPDSPPILKKVPIAITREEAGRIAAEVLTIGEG